jgi:septal ring factor EnvC (AmiA/AmiB activator)
MRWRRSVLWIMLMALAWACAAADASKPALDGRKVELGQLRARIAELTGNLHLDRDRLSNYQRQLRDIERDIARHALALKELDSQIRQNQRLLDKLQQQRLRQDEALQRHRQLLGRQLQSAYRMGNQDRLKLLLSQQDPGRVVRLLKYHEYINRARSRQVERLGELIASLTSTRRGIDEKQQAIVELREQTLQRHRDLAGGKQQRSTLMERLAGEIEHKDGQLASLKRDEAGLQRLIAQLQQAMTELARQERLEGRFPRRKGRMAWPVRGSLGARFGKPRGAGMRWDGVFIRAGEGSEVRAVHPGRVAFADWLRGYGLLLIVDHGEGYMSLYGHNQTLYKAVGDAVGGGEAVAQAGAGTQNGSGIYFGIRHQGKPLDPVKWCKGKGG